MNDYIKKSDATPTSKVVEDLLRISDVAHKYAQPDVAARFVDAVNAMTTELLTIPDKLSIEIKDLYGIEIDRASVEMEIHSALTRMANTLQELTAHNDISGGYELRMDNESVYTSNDFRKTDEELLDPP